MAVAAAVGFSTSATAWRMPSIPNVPPPSVRRSVPFGWRLASADHVVVVEERVRQVVELARFVVGEALGLAALGVREHGHAGAVEDASAPLRAARRMLRR